MSAVAANIKSISLALLRSSEQLGFALKRRLPATRVSRWLVDLILLPSDLRKVLFQYRGVFGHFPNLLRPKTFNEFLQADKLFRRSAIRTQCADKVRVRDFVKARIGERYLNEMYWSGRDLRMANYDDLPQSFFVKANNGSGTNVFVRDKREVDWVEVCNKSAQWLERDRSQTNAEWQYRWIEPQILIEKPLLDSEGNFCFDYKMLMFRGKCRIVQVDFHRFSKHRRNFYDTEQNLLEFQKGPPRMTDHVAFPACWGEMIEAGEKLAAGFPFVRVDFYALERPIFGEMTFHPMAGIGGFSPPEWDARLGALLSRYQS